MDQMKTDHNVLTALEFIEVRTHFWQNEDPLKGRRSMKGDLGLKGKTGCADCTVSRQDTWEELPFKNYVQTILSRKSSNLSKQKIKR